MLDKQDPIKIIYTKDHFDHDHMFNYNIVVIKKE